MINKVVKLIFACFLLFNNTRKNVLVWKNASITKKSSSFFTLVRTQEGNDNKESDIYLIAKNKSTNKLNKKNT